MLLAYSRANWVKVEEITYKSPCTVVLRVDDSYPVFGQLKEFTSSMTMLPYMCRSRKPSDLMNTHSYVIKATKSYETGCKETIWPLASTLPQIGGWWEDSANDYTILKYNILGTVMPDSEFWCTAYLEHTRNFTIWNCNVYSCICITIHCCLLKH